MFEAINFKKTKANIRSDLLAAISDNCKEAFKLKLLSTKTENEKSRNTWPGFKELTLDHAHYVFLGLQAPENIDSRLYFL